MNSGRNETKIAQDKDTGSLNMSTRNGGRPALNKSEARASIPTYDRSTVKKVQTGMRGLKKN